MKKLLIIVGALVIVTIGGCLLSGLVNWLVADIGRFTLASVIGAYIIYRIGKPEFDR